MELRTPLNSGKQVVPTDRWPSGDGRPIAVLGCTPSELAKLGGLEFETDHDGLDFFELAAIAIPQGQLWLMRYRNSTSPGTVVVADAASDPSEAERACLEVLGLPGSAVTWSLTAEIRQSGTQFTLLLDETVRVVLADLLSCTLKMSKGAQVIDHVSDQPWGDLEEFRSQVYCPLHGEQSTAQPPEVAMQLTLEPRETALLRGIIDSLAEGWSGGVPWVGLDADERAVILKTLERLDMES